MLGILVIFISTFIVVIIFDFLVKNSKGLQKRVGEINKNNWLHKGNKKTGHEREQEK